VTPYLINQSSNQEFKEAMTGFSGIVRFARQNYEYLILGSLIIFVLASNIIWLEYDNSLVENRDSTIFLTRTIEFIEKTKSSDFDFFASLEKLTLGGRPVLLQLLGIPFIEIFGPSLDAYTYVNFLFYIILVIATYQIGKEAKGKNAGLLAAILVVAYPSVVRLSKLALTSFAVIACVALTTWFLVRFTKTRSIKDAWLTNLSLAFGFWVHPSFLWGVPIPAALLLLYTVFFGTEPKWVARAKELPAWLLGKLRQPIFLAGVLPSALLSIGVILTWYVPFGSTILSVTENVASYIPEGMRFFLGPSYSIIPYPFWYAVTSTLALSTVLAIFFWISLVATNIRKEPQALNLTILFIGAYIAHNILLLGLGWRYFSQVLPIMAALTAIWVVSVKNRPAFRFLVIACVAVSVFNFATISWGVNPVTQPVAAMLGMRNYSAEDYCRPSFAFYCADPPKTEKWPIREILSVVLNDPKCSVGNCSLLVVPQSIYFFQAFPFSAAVDFPDAELNINILLDPGVWGSDVNVPLGFFDIPALLESDYIVYHVPDAIVPNNQSPSMEWFLATHHFLNSPPPLFSASHQVVAEFTLPDGRNALIYQRTQPLTLEEAEQAISALELSEEAKLLKYEVFISLAKQEEDNDRVISLYQEALTHTQDTEMRITYLTGLADTYFSTGQRDFAIMTYQQALSLDPEDLTLHLNLSRIYMELDDCENAIPHLAELARLQPSALRYTNLGETYRRCGNLEDAIIAFQKALTFDGKDARAHLGLALSYDVQHRIEEARAEFEKVILYAPESNFARRAQEWLDTNK